MALCSSLKKGNTSLVLYISLEKIMGKITVIKKCELHNTTVYLVNDLPLPNMVGIHYLQISGQIFNFH